MTTNLTCLDWMSNQEGQNPCTVAQEVGQLCNSGYIVSMTNFSENNYIPNATTANNCTCSWSFYNLLSACSSCVGQNQYTSWSAWTTSCGSYGSNNSFLPPGLSLSQGIPYWATTNPSTWDNGIFNITQATNTAEQDKSDVTGVPLSTSTTTASSASSISVGAIVGGVIGGIVIILIGGLLIFWMVRCRRRQRTHTVPTRVPSFNPSQPGIVPSTWNRTSAQPTPYGYPRRSSAPADRYIASPVHSTTSLAPTSLVSHVSPRFPSTRHSTAPPIMDAADMIIPFLATSTTHQRNRSDTSPMPGKADEALSKRVEASSGQRARLNPPSYSASVVPGSSGAPTTWSRRLSMTKHKRRKGSESGTTMYSGHSRTSTKESVTTGCAGPPTVRSAEGTVNAGGVGSVDDGGGVGGGGGGVEITHSRRTGI